MDHQVELRVPGRAPVALKAREAKWRTLAFDWAYVARNRSLWSSSSTAREHASSCVDLLSELGATPAMLHRLAKASFIEVAVPAGRQSAELGMRMIPWEYVLSAATRALGRTETLVVTRHLQTKRDWPLRSWPQTHALRGLTVMSHTAALDDEYSYESEVALLDAHFGIEAKAFGAGVTKAELAKACREHPHIVHVGGIDTHHADRIFTRRGIERADGGKPIKDGILLRNLRNPRASLDAHRLSQILIGATAGEARLRAPMLAVFNVYHSAARTASFAVERGSDFAVGFQDDFDDLAAEYFVSELYRGVALGHDVFAAFVAALRALGRKPMSLAGSGIVLWSRHSLIPAAARSLNAAAALDAQFQRERAQPIQIEPGTHLSDLVECRVRPYPNVNYSLLHNGQPFFSSLNFSLKPQLRGHLKDMRLEVELDAGSAAPLKFSRAFALSNDGIDLQRDAFLPLTSPLARSLSENLHSSVLVRLTHAGQTIYEAPHSVRLSATNEWIDDDETRHFLPSFVYPLAPEVSRVIRDATTALRVLADDPNAGFDGYQQVDAKDEASIRGLDNQVSAIWHALRDLRISYVNPPPSYRESSQRLRSPTTVIKSLQGTCIDLALLFAACLEYVDIYPVIILLHEHAFPGYWRTQTDWENFVRGRERVSEILSSDPRSADRPAPRPGSVPWVFPSHALVQHVVESGQLVPLETVGLTDQSGFADAQDKGWENLDNPREFHSLIDIVSARSAKPAVTPLPIA